jgi:hypothetical protein
MPNTCLVVDLLGQKLSEAWLSDGMYFYLDSDTGVTYAPDDVCAVSDYEEFYRTSVTVYDIASKLLAMLTCPQYKSAVGVRVVWVAEGTLVAVQYIALRTIDEVQP